MAWLDLRSELAEEFETFSGKPDDTYDTGRRLESQVRRSDPVRWAWEYAGCKRRRRQKRIARAAARGPCPHCGGKVERIGATAKIPIYCTPKCARAARWARWYAKHGVEHNARRRKAGA